MALVTVLIFASMLVLIFAVLRIVVEPRVVVGLRLRRLTAAEPDGTQAKAPKLRLRKIPQFGWMNRLDSRLKRAEIDIPAKEFVVRWVLVVLCISLIIFLAAGWIGLLLAVAMSYTGTFFYLGFRGQRRIRRFDGGLHDMLTIVSNSLNAGHSFVQALHIVSEDMQGPIQEEFLRMEAEMQVGVGLEEALQRANERVGSEDFDLIVTAVSIQRQVGGNLSEILAKIAETIRERVKLKREIKALTAQGRISAGIFMFMPIGVGALMYMISPAYISVLFQTTLGIGMLIAAAVGQLIGFFFIRKIISIDL